MQQKAPAEPGLLSFAKSKRSVAGCNRRRSVAAEAVVEPYGDQIHVLVDPIDAGNEGGRDHERVGVGVGVAIPHEEMVVLHADRPVRSEADLDACAECAAPTGVVATGREGRTARLPHRADRLLRAPQQEGRHTGNVESAPRLHGRPRGRTVRSVTEAALEFLCGGRPRHAAQRVVGDAGLGRQQPPRAGLPPAAIASVRMSTS